MGKADIESLFLMPDSLFRRVNEGALRRKPLEIPRAARLARLTWHCGGAGAMERHEQPQCLLHITPGQAWHAAGNAFKDISEGGGQAVDNRNKHAEHADACATAAQTPPLCVS